MGEPESILHELLYVRSLMQEHLDLRECPHDGQFAGCEPECRMCDQDLECAWLSQDRDFRGSRPVTPAQLREELELARSFVRARLSSLGNHGRGCSCDACAWLVRTGGMIAPREA